MPCTQLSLTRLGSCFVASSELQSRRYFIGNCLISHQGYFLNCIIALSSYLWFRRSKRPHRGFRSVWRHRQCCGRRPSPRESPMRSPESGSCAETKNMTFRLHWRRIVPKLFDWPKIYNMALKKLFDLFWMSDKKYRDSNFWWITRMSFPTIITSNPFKQRIGNDTRPITLENSDLSDKVYERISKIWLATLDPSETHGSETL